MPETPTAGRWQGLLVLVGSGLLLLAAALQMGESRQWWQPSVALRFRTHTAAGLQRGMPVKISGFTVGHVRAIQLQPDAEVLVDLAVGETYRGMVGRRSRARLAQDSLLGQAYVAISPDPGGSGQRGISGGELIAYDPRPDLESLLRDLARVPDPLERLLRSGANLADQRLPQSLGQLDQTLIASRQLAQRLDREAGSSGRALRRGLADALTGLEGGLRSLEDTRASIATTLAASERAGERTLPQLLLTLQELNAMARNTNALVERLQSSWLFELVDRPPLGPQISPVSRPSSRPSSRPQSTPPGPATPLAPPDPGPPPSGD